MINQQIFINGRFLTQKITGVQRNAYELTKHLLPLLGNVTILMPKAPVNAGYDITGWPIRKIGFTSGTGWEQMELPFFLLKKWNKPLLINLTNTAPSRYSRQIVSIMDMTTFINPLWFNKKFAAYYQWLVPKIARRSRSIFTISENSKKDIIKYTGVPEDKVKVLYCGISDIFSSDKPVQSGIMERLGLKPHSYFLAVSSLDPRKNFKMLIDAFLHSGIQTPLVIVGSKGKVFNDMQLNIDTIDSSKVIFTDYINDEDLKALYKSSLCFVYPSLYEGFGIPPLEAMANGCPTIVSNTSSLPEVCGNASLYIDPYDRNSITDAMKEVLNDESLRKELIARGKENVKRFNWNYSAQMAVTEIQRIV